jgi:hypothetical protein
MKKTNTVKLFLGLSLVTTIAIPTLMLTACAHASFTQIPLFITGTGDNNTIFSKPQEDVNEDQQKFLVTEDDATTHSIKPVTPASYDQNYDTYTPNTYIYDYNVTNASNATYYSYNSPYDINTIINNPTDSNKFQRFDGQ